MYQTIPTAKEGGPSSPAQVGARRRCGFAARWRFYEAAPGPRAVRPARLQAAPREERSRRTRSHERQRVAHPQTRPGEVAGAAAHLQRRVSDAARRRSGAEAHPDTTVHQPRRAYRRRQRADDVFLVEQVLHPEETRPGCAPTSRDAVKSTMAYPGKPGSLSPGTTRAFGVVVELPADVLHPEARRSASAHLHTPPAPTRDAPALAAETCRRASGFAANSRHRGLVEYIPGRHAPIRRERYSMSFCKPQMCVRPRFCRCWVFTQIACA